ncbi:response regulator transcription factor [Streptomyces beigongshangae]|uniref:response regulator transcription factor n=1 Tax=Streptomyces beigongshangae TaxID=2841597 RepID=UPI001C84D47B|nr:response regulator transcription factor [Streptomyces sp. REN17]
MSEVAVLLLDDDRLFREGIREVLNGAGGIRIVGEADDEGGAARLARDGCPDVVLLGPDTSAALSDRAIRQVMGTFPAARLVVFVGEEAWTVRRLMALGVSACLARRSSAHELASVLRTVAYDADRVVLSVPRGTLRWLEGRDGLLSRRESELLALAADGAGNARIAEKLFLSVGTVKRHFSNIYAKLHVSSRAEAVNVALRSGLITCRSRPVTWFEHVREFQD